MNTWFLAEQFLTAKVSSWAKATHANRFYHLKLFAEGCPDLPQTPEPIERFLASVPGPLYRYNIWLTLRQFYAWAERRREINNPCPLVEAPRKPKAMPYFLEEQELVNLLRHPHPKRTKALLYLLADTGMRIGEAHSMTVENMKDGWVYVNGKGGWRWVPVSKNVMKMLRKVAPKSGPFWIGERGPLTVTGMKRSVWVAFHKAGLVGEKMSAHRLRHTFATLWTGNDADCMDVGGWRDWRTYRVYRTTRKPHLANAHAQHSPVTRLGLA